MEHEDELLEQVRQYALVAEKPSRYEHSVRVAETARDMCARYGLDPRKGYLAGLAHDICKDMGDEMLVSLASHDGLAISALERKKPALLHGRAAAEKLRRDYGVTDGDVLQAVACHTLGEAGLCRLAKIVFAADKIEPGRPQSTPEYRARLFGMGLDALCRAVLEENMAYLRSRGKDVAPASFRFREDLARALAADGGGDAE